MSKSISPIHPGQYIRDSILTPRKLSVTAAAKLLGIGRPALSNFLNGHVATSTEMAFRIEVAFGIPAQRLLDMQSAYDTDKAKAKGVPANAIPYVVPFLRIKAADIEAWVERNILSRTRLSVFLRTLVNSTGTVITEIDFPGNDDAERPGWDGHINCAQPTQWIPEGLSGWEFGTNQDIKRKADNDFAKSVKAVTKAERDQTTFVFVTPRHWPGPEKLKWIKENKAKNLWKDVRAYDASDLEQWLEQSIAAQAWFANETLRPSNGVYSLDKCWADWATVANPPLVGSLFASIVDGAKQTMLSKLLNQPEEPIVIAADSVEEALAFLAQLFDSASGGQLDRYRDRVLVFDEPGVLPKLAQGTKDFIAVAANREVERELGPLARTMHTIVVYPRNAANVNPHVVLEPLSFDIFSSSLEEIGYSRDDITKYSNESGRSLTVLRRRLANVPAIQTPAWADDYNTASSLIPFLFIGAWSSTNTADQAVLTLLANEVHYEKLEKTCQRLAGMNDAPLWSVGIYRGVVSKIDLLFAIACSITRRDLEHYFDIAKIVLGEDDPALDLPEGERWAAPFHGNLREFSGTLREGISETLVLLAVHGNHLFRSRLGFDCEAAVNQLVRELLTPLKTRLLEANDRDLAAYAEAAPDEFLSILEQDLKIDYPECYGLMRPSGTGIFNDCPRIGLLWALEGLAWNPSTLPRTALVLAQLAEIEINDNWSHKPIRSLESIFCVWMPQTAADHETCIRVINLLADKFPKVAWKICIEQINTGYKTGEYSHKPRWRNDGHGFGEPIKSKGLVLSFMQEMTVLVLNWKGGHTIEMLCDLIEHLHDLPEEKRANVWELVNSWAEAGVSDTDKACIREKIRITALSRGWVHHFKKAECSKLATAAKATYQKLEPSDLLIRHEWLFREHWVQEWADELHDDEMDFQKREAQITKLRVEVLREILELRGLPGVFELAEKGNAASVIGSIIAKELLREEEIHSFLLAALLPSSTSQSWARNNLISGVLYALDDEKKRVELLNKIKSELLEADFVRLLLLAPFRRSTWLLIDVLGEEHRETYWNNVTVNSIIDDDDQNHEAVVRLLAVPRPRAAFACVYLKLNILEPELLFRLLSEIAKNEGKDQPGHYQLKHYSIEKAFALIDKSPMLSLEQKAGLEFAYIDALSQPWSKGESYGIPNLEKYVKNHPELFVQAIVWTYRRNGEGVDPPEWKFAPEQVQRFAEIGRKLLDGLYRIPGHDDLGVLQTDKLAVWVKIVREACANLDRLDIADICLGKLLSGAPLGNDGVWPCEPVRQVMEEVHSKNMIAGMRTGRYNARGAHRRGEDGTQERELADIYRVWENELRYSHPFVASELLKEMVWTYEHEANREDTEACLRRRLR
ncbi:MAG: HigA family addiction module antitoxin [Halobacteriota archaeon]